MLSLYLVLLSIRRNPLSRRHILHMLLLLFDKFLLTYSNSGDIIALCNL